MTEEKKYSIDEVDIYVAGQKVEKPTKSIECNSIDRTAVYLVDINYYIYSGHFAVNLTSRGQAIGGLFTTIKGLVKLMKSAKRIVAVIDSEYCFKKEQVHTYKAHRESIHEIKYQREALISFITAMNIPMCRVQGYEADDLIATLTTYYKMMGIPSVICGIDKDLCALVDDTCLMYNMQTGTMFDRNAIFAKYGIYPEQFEEYLSLVGDSADGFKGLPGIGPKKAVDMIKAYGSVGNILRNLDTLKHQYKRYFTDPDSLESLRESIILATLNRDVPGLEAYHNPTYHQMNVVKYNELCTWHGFKSLLITTKP